MLGVPLLRDGKAIGVIRLDRTELGRSPTSRSNWSQTFADQAVIAIENVRLFDETQEALERQTATADILKVIASSPDDVQPVFEAIAERSNRIVEAGRRPCTALSMTIAAPDGVHAVEPGGRCGAAGFVPATVVADSDGRADRLKARSFTIVDVEVGFHRSTLRGNWRGCAVFVACWSFRCCASDKPIGVDQRDARRVRPFRRPPCPVAADLRRSGRDRHLECRAVRTRCSSAPESCRDPSTISAPRRTAWSRPKNSPRSASSPRASRTRSRTRSISSIISRRCRRN